MGEGKSLLAKVVIENMEHECSFPGCDMKLPLNKYKQHQEEECLYRKVLCPSSTFHCQALVPFCELDQHIRSCEDIVLLNQTERFSIGVPSNTWNGNINWRSFAFPFNSGCIYIRMNKVGGLFTIDTVLNGTKDECRTVTVDLHILNCDTKEAEIKFSIHPRPITEENTNNNRISVSAEAISALWKYDTESKKHIVDMKIVVHSGMLQQQTQCAKRKSFDVFELDSFSDSD